MPGGVSRNDRCGREGPGPEAGQYQVMSIHTPPHILQRIVALVCAASPLSLSLRPHTGVGRRGGWAPGKSDPFLAGWPEGGGQVIEFGSHLTPGAIRHKRWSECFPFRI